MFGRSLENSLGDPTSTAREIQANASLYNEMERIRSALNEVRDSLVDVKLEIARANAFIELSQQGQATNRVVRETATLLNSVNTNLVAVHETVIQLVAATGCLNKSLWIK